VARKSECEYEFGQHSSLGLTRGVTEQEIYELGKGGLNRPRGLFGTWKSSAQWGD
jgi:hypothetical protein